MKLQRRTNDCNEPAAHAHTYIYLCAPLVKHLHVY